MFSIEQIIYIKMDLALNNLQRLICHKTKQTKPNPMFVSILRPRHNCVEITNLTLFSIKRRCQIKEEMNLKNVIITPFGISWRPVVCQPVGS